MNAQMQQTILKGFLWTAIVLGVVTTLIVATGGKPKSVPSPGSVSPGNYESRPVVSVPRDSELYSESSSRRATPPPPTAAPLPRPVEPPRPKLQPITETFTIPTGYYKEIFPPEGYVVTSIETEGKKFAAVVDGQRTIHYSLGGNPLTTPAKRVQIQSLGGGSIEVTVRFEER